MVFERRGFDATDSFLLGAQWKLTINIIKRHMLPEHTIRRSRDINCRRASNARRDTFASFQEHQEERKSSATLCKNPKALQLSLLSFS